jgi:exosortase A-associated hydrolase 2
MRSPLAGHFIPGRKGHLFLVRRSPSVDRGCVLVVPPFAEEMNKTRRMITLLAVRLADRGLSTIVPDLYGTGDSGGDFADADWSTWRDDLIRIARWGESTNSPVTALLAVRLGCALACDTGLLDALPRLQRTVFWQPALDGSRYLAQFLRLRTAASMANGIKESAADLRQSLADVGHLDIAGYRLSAQMAAELEAVKPPDILAARLGPVTCFELAREDSQPPSAATARLVESSRAAGISVEAHAMAGEPFWSTTEIVTHEGLLEQTLLAVTDGSPALNGPAGAVP